jgi:hypothetical protein
VGGFVLCVCWTVWGRFGVGLGGECVVGGYVL